MYLRYAVYLLVIAVCSSVTHVAFQHTGSFAIDGGFLMFMVSTMTLVAGAGGTMFYVNHRNEIIEQVRHYLFGIMTIPGMSVSLIMWGSTGMVDQAAAQDSSPRASGSASRSSSIAQSSSRRSCSSS